MTTCFNNKTNGLEGERGKKKRQNLSCSCSSLVQRSLLFFLYTLEVTP